MGKYDELRKEALEQLKEGREALSLMIPSTMEELIHELEVHHAELEVQNENLRTAQEEIAQLHQKYFYLFDTAPIGYLLLSPKARILQINQLAASWLGIHQPLQATPSLLAYFTATSLGSFLNFLKQVFATGNRLTEEFQWKRTPQRPDWVQAIAQRSQDEPDQCLLILKDISEEKNAEAQLIEAKGVAEAASQAKSQFLTNMSHEIRTPMNAILGFCELLIQHSQQATLPQIFHEYLANLKTGGETLLELINNILDLSKIEAGKMEVFEEELNLKVLIQGVFHLNKAQAMAKWLNYTYDYDPNLSEYILSDRTKLNQILNNLVNNAIKFTLPRRSVHLSAQNEGERLILQVKDQGIGIPPEKLASIFESFIQADNSITRQFGGSGLGLAISRKMVHLMRGDIQVESEVGNGTCFTIQLPLKTVKTPKRLTLTNSSKIRFHESAVVLIAEDNVINQTVIQGLLHNIGVRTHVIENGQQAIEAAERLQPSLILMDLHMPQMSGIEATKIIKKSAIISNIPIVALSADAFQEQQDKALSVGFNDYLTKPIALEQLIEVLAKYLPVRSGNAADSNSDVVTSPLPNEKQHRLEKLFKELARVPIFRAEVIVQFVDSMQTLCHGYQTHYVELLKEIEDAAYTGNTEKYEQLLKEWNG